MRKWVIIGGIVVAAIVLLCIALAVGRHTADKELERYKAELRAKGEKLTFAEFQSAPSTNADEVASRIAYSQFSIPYGTNKPELMTYLAPGKARVVWRGAFRINGATNDTGFGGWENLAAEERKDSTNLELLLAALKHPAADSGTVYRDDFRYLTIVTPLQVRQYRTATDFLVREAVINLHENRTEVAVSNLVASAALARMFRDEPILLADLVRGVNVRSGVQATWELLQATNLNEAALAALQQAWEAVDLYEGLERGFEFERTVNVLQYEAMGKMTSSELAQSYGAPTQARPNSPAMLAWSIQKGLIFFGSAAIHQDEKSVLAYWTGGIEGVRLLKDNCPIAEVTNQVALAEAEIAKAKASKWGFRIQALQRAVSVKLNDDIQHIAEIETMRRMCVTAIAIKRYQLKHGTAPASLEALVPEFLTAVPIDPMSGKALGYRRNADGTFVLYSVGLDGKDDGGDPTPTAAGGTPGMWEGRDAVWPAAATVEEQEKADGEFVEGEKGK